jgi:imidazolonepropionase-like amidohydrolase
MIRAMWRIWIWSVALAASGETVLIRNAKVLTVTKGAFDGSVLIRNGKIVAAAPQLAPPEGARLVDAGGQYLMPGIVDCHSHIAADAINESSVSVSSMVTMEDVLDPEDIAIYRALAGGVTTANILHGSANAIGGQCTVIKLRWGKRAHELLFAGAKPGIKFALGENPKRRGSSPTAPRYPATRMGVEDIIRQAFTEARAYQAEWRAYLAGRHALPRPRRDLRLEPLVEVLEGKRLVHAHCYRSDEILMLLRLAEEFGFRIKTLQHVLEGYKVAKEIAAHGAGASTFSDWWSYKMEAYDAIPYNAALMHRKGVLVSLNSDSAELMRRLNTEAAKVIKYGGLSETEALAMITINPARQLELDDRIGSIEPGKDADLVLFDKHPLSSFAKVQKVFIDGVEYFDRDRDLSERRERTKPRPQPAPESKPVAPELETAPAKPVPPPSENAKPQRGKP